MWFIFIDIALWIYMIYISYKAYNAYKSDYDENVVKSDEVSVVNLDTVVSSNTKDVDSIDGIFNSIGNFLYCLRIFCKHFGYYFR